MGLKALLFAGRSRVRGYNFTESQKALEFANTSLAPPIGEKAVHVDLVLHFANGAVIKKRFADSSEAARFLTSQ